MKKPVKTLGGRAIGRRTTLGKALDQWRADLLRDLGGSEEVSTQKLALVDLAVRTKLMLDSIDNWILTQPSLINARRHAILPVVRERQQLSDALSKYLCALGLERRAKQAGTLSALLARPTVLKPPRQTHHNSIRHAIQALLHSLTNLDKTSWRAWRPTRNR